MENFYIFYSSFSRCRIVIAQYILDNYNPIVIEMSFNWKNIKKYKDLEYTNIDNLLDNRYYLFRGILNTETLEKLSKSNKKIFIVALNDDPIIRSNYFKNKILAIYDKNDENSSKFLIGDSYKEMDSTTYFKILKRKLIFNKFK